MKSKRMLKISEVADILGVSTSAVRLYANDGRLPFTLTPGGQRVFSPGDVARFAGVPDDRGFVFYVRSSKGSRTAMTNQSDELEAAYGKPLKVYREFGSGLNENRKYLNKMLDDSASGQFSTVYVTHEDRLARFGVSFIRRLLAEDHVKVVALHDDRKSDREEIMSDFMAILASFSGRYYRLRSSSEKRDFLDEARKQVPGDD
jgi:putative resolvase